MNLAERNKIKAKILRNAMDRAIESLCGEGTDYYVFKGLELSEEEAFKIIESAEKELMKLERKYRSKT